MAMSRTRKIVLVILGVVLALAVVAFLCIAVIISALREQEPAIADHSVLVLKLGGTLPDYANEDPVARMFGAQSNSLTGVLTQLRKAKADKRIDAVLLDLDFVGAGWAKADEIRDAIADFRSSGKPV